MPTRRDERIESVESMYSSFPFPSIVLYIGSKMR